jgi:hypothetical protein
VSVVARDHAPAAPGAGGSGPPGPGLAGQTLAWARAHRAIRRSRPVTVGLAILAVVVARPGYLPIPFVIALLPLAALVVAAVADTAWGRPPRRRLLAAATSWRTRGAKAGRALRAAAVAGVVVAAVGVAGPGWRDRDLALMTVDQDAPMAAAERWIGANLPRTSRILVDDSLWVDLVRRGHAPHRTVWFWKLDRDPEIRARYPHGWRDFDDVVSTTAVRGSVHDLPQVSEALRHATVAASFGRGEHQVQVLRIHAG